MKKGIWILCAVLVLGILCEFLANLPALLSPARNQAKQIPLSSVTGTGFAREKEFLSADETEVHIHIPLDGSYITEFSYDYAYDGLLNARITLGTRNPYGEVHEKEALQYFDRNMAPLHRSIVPVRDKADYIELSVYRWELGDEGLEDLMDFANLPLRFTAFESSCVPRVNPLRLGFFWAVFAVAGMVFCLRDVFARHIERGFLVMALCFGLLFSLSLPANKVSWDEEVHFSQVFWLANYKKPIDITNPVLMEFITGMDTWPYNQPGGAEEQKLLDSYLEEQARYGEGEHHWSADVNWTTVTGYAGSAVMVKAAEILHLPFQILWKLGRLGNLLVYCAIMYAAIRLCPAGKAIMAFLALMPEPLFLAGTYSYDPTVNAFLWLSFALMLRYILPGQQEKISWKMYALILLTFFWGCRIKAVYAPLLLLGLFIPKERYRSRRECLLMRAGFLLLTAGLILSFVLPVVMAPRDIGDLRGGDTSEKGQMAYILGQPLGYAKILAESIFRTFPSYCFGEASLGLLGHIRTITHTWLLYAGAAMVILTGTGQKQEEERASSCPGWKFRLPVFLLAGFTAVLVWTSMYIAFTVPGKAAIEGVQGRYYLPFLFLLWFIFSPPGISLKIREEKYNALVLGLAALILSSTWWSDIYMLFCR